MVRSAYVALYKAVMNINEDGCQPHGWHSLEGDRWIKRDTPTALIFALYCKTVNVLIWYVCVNPCAGLNPV